MTNTCKCGHDEENHYLGTDGCANCYKVDKYLCTKFEPMNETKTESVEEKQKQFPSYWQRELEIDYIHAAWLVGEFRTEISKAEQRVIDSIWSEITDKGNMIRDDENGDYYEVKISKKFMRDLEGDEPK